jgi:tetratricopeptide (TPR) repeat protein
MRKFSAKRKMTFLFVLLTVCILSVVFFQKGIKSLYYTNLSVLSALKGDTALSYQQSILAKKIGFINSGQYYNQYMLDHNISDLSRAFFLNPTNVNFIFLFADETILKGDWLSSNQHFNQIPFARYLARRGTELANDSDSINAKKGLYYLSYARKILAEPQISNSLGSILCFKYKSYQKGESLLWEALIKNPRNISFYDSLSQVFANQGKKELYRSFNELTRRMNPSNLTTLLNIGTSLVNENKIEEGIHYFLYAKAKDQKMPKIHYLLAKAYEKQEKPTLAEKEYFEAIETNPTDSGPRFEWGQVLFQRKDFKRAITQFTIAITLKPDYVWNYYYRGLCYEENQNWQKALTDFNQCLSMEPSNKSFMNRIDRLNKLMDQHN